MARMNPCLTPLDECNEIMFGNFEDNNVSIELTDEHGKSSRSRPNRFAPVSPKKIMQS